jgi:hypothetical protein
MKEKQRRARREEAERQIEYLQRELRQLTEAEARAAETASISVASTTATRPHDETNAELIAVKAEMRMLRERMDALQQQQQVSDPPEYTARASRPGPSSM